MIRKSPPREGKSSLLGYAAVAVLTLLLAIAATVAVIRRIEAHRLLTAEADTILAEPALVEIATRIAVAPYKAHCAACHGAAMHGNPALGVPDLTDRDWLYGEGRVAEVETTILYGIRSGLPKARSLADMPAFGTARPYARYVIPPLAPDDIRDVAAFLGARMGRRENPEAAARGRDIYAHRGGCFDCHGEDAGGDPAIGAPNLVDAVHLYGDGSDAATARSIAQGRAGLCPGWAGKISPIEIRALAVMVAARSHDGKAS